MLTQLVKGAGMSIVGILVSTKLFRLCLEQPVITYNGGTCVFSTYGMDGGVCIHGLLKKLSEVVRIDATCSPKAQSYVEGCIRRLAVFFATLYSFYTSGQETSAGIALRRQGLKVLSTLYDIEQACWGSRETHEVFRITGVLREFVTKRTLIVEK